MFQDGGVDEPGAGSFSRPADESNENRFEEQEGEPGCDRWDSPSALTSERKEDQVDRQQERNGFKRDATRAGGTNSSVRKELQSAVCQQQRKQYKHHLAGMKTPSQQESSRKNGVVIEIDGRCRDGQQSAVQQHCGQKQKYASGY